MHSAVKVGNKHDIPTDILKARVTKEMFKYLFHIPPKTTTNVNDILITTQFHYSLHSNNKTTSFVKILE